MENSFTTWSTSFLFKAKVKLNQLLILFWNKPNSYTSKSKLNGSQQIRFDSSAFRFAHKFIWGLRSTNFARLSEAPFSLKMQIFKLIYLQFIVGACNGKPKNKDTKRRNTQDLWNENKFSTYMCKGMIKCEIKNVEKATRALLWAVIYVMDAWY